MKEKLENSKNQALKIEIYTQKKKKKKQFGKKSHIVMAEILISDIDEKMISANDALPSDPPEARPHRKTQRLRRMRRRQRRCFLLHCQPLLDIATQRSRRRRRRCRGRRRGLRSQRSRSTNLGRRRGCEVTGK